MDTPPGLRVFIFLLIEDQKACRNDGVPLPPVQDGTFLQETSN